MNKAENPRHFSLRQLIICALLLFGAGYLLGLILGTPLALPNGSPASISEMARAQAEWHRVLESLLTRPVHNIEPTHNATLSPTLQEALEKLALLQDPLERAYKATVLAEGLGFSGIPAAIAWTASLPPGPQREDIHLAFLRRWGALDARSALAYAISPEALSIPARGILAILEGWGRERPQDAWNWTMENPSSLPNQIERLRTVLLAISKTDLPKAFDFAQSLPDGLLKTEAFTTLADHLLWGARAELATAWFENLPHSEARDQTLAYIAGQWARYDPEEALRWVNTFAESSKLESAYLSIAENRAAHDPLGTAQWAQTVPPGEFRHRLLESTAWAWLAHPDGAPELADWLNQQEAHADFDGAIKALVMDIAPRDPPTAFSWSLALHNRDDRALTLTITAREWLHIAPDNARQAIEDAPIDPSLRRLLLGQADPNAPQPLDLAKNIHPEDLTIPAGHTQTFTDSRLPDNLQPTVEEEHEDPQESSTSQLPTE